ncbi:MAG: AmmeMemoRadiSam system protein A [Halopseudomonas sp.]
MVRSRSIDLPSSAQQQLLAIARAAICAPLKPSRREPLADTHSADWNRPAACFVTLHEIDNQRLRGCIGTLEADKPLAQAVAYYAEQAAFHDPRFSPLRADELAKVEIEISVLSGLTPLPVKSEAELLSRLKPNIDGLWLQAGAARATYLPQVWQQLSEPSQFVSSLKQKAGLDANSWSDSFAWSTYSVQHFSEAQLLERTDRD